MQVNTELEGSSRRNLFRAGAAGLVGAAAVGVFAPAAEANARPLQAKAYVTVGEDRTDDFQTDGTNDTSQIQAAIDHVAGEGGGIVFIRAGTYNISATIMFPFDPHVRIVGEEFVKSASNTVGGTALVASAELTDMFAVVGRSNPAENADLSHGVQFEQLTLDGGGQTTNLLKLSNQDCVVVNLCRMRGATNSITTVWDSDIDPTAPTIPGALFVSNSIVSANSGIGIDLQYQTQCWISNVWFSGGSVKTWLNMMSSNKIKITNCEFNTAAEAIHLRDTATYPTHNITVTGCVFALGAGNAAWRDSRTHGYSRSVAITGCTLAGGETYDSLANFGNVLNNGNTHYTKGTVAGPTEFDRVRGQHIAATLTGDITVSLPAGGYRGDTLTLQLSQDAAGGHQVSWPANVKYADGDVALSTEPNALDLITLSWDGASWVELSRSLNVS
ncbi:glycosyl hydrolase family 28-related protein [Phytoactinopolyspora endophytica]|uniref:glycosyl hydrolase family 28-related protein n=1 Tax=Phytoactinopolyspora endophytica TaxID=1642495 RepID=UPI0013EC75A8|nr:glycosyl hydrolase family 28-related protein [Phytoactinopolyspora endophytica]